MTRLLDALNALDAFDRRLFARLTRRERRVIDRGLKRLTTAANRSLLWLAIAALLSIVGGGRGRRAALRGVVAIGITSSLVNLPLKYLARRDRPPRRRFDRPLPVSLPGSFSFPSGHSASAFAFLTGVALEDPRLLPPILPLATGVAYSRVHLRVHYPFDVVAGAGIGALMGLASGPVIRAGRRWWQATARVPDQDRPHTNRIILVLSPGAGRHGGLRRARKAMAQLGIEVVAELPVSQVKRLPVLLQRQTAPDPIVVAAGGDGTVSAVADHVVGRHTVMGIIPLGTSNDFARSLSIPMHIERAVGLLVRGQVTRVDAGRLVREGEPPRHFVHAAAVGLNVSFARLATRADFRERFGRLSYAVAAALTLRERPVFSCELEWPGGTDRVQLVHLSVINAPVFGGFLGLKIPGAAADDRQLNVLMVEHLPLRRLIRSALYPAIGLHRRIRGFRALQITRLRIAPTEPKDVTVDGEIAGRVPGVVEVVPAGLRVVTPVSFEDHSR